MAAAIACTMTVYAEGDGKKKGGKRPGPSPEAKKALLERFDTNKDGKLSEDERKAAREAMAKKRKEIKDAVLAEFDKNGNGKLDEDEREGVREWIKENYPHARPPHGKGKGKKGKGPHGKGKKGDGPRGKDKPEEEAGDA